MNRIFAALIFLSCMAFPIHAQTSGNTPPPPPYCTSANAGKLYTDTGTSPATVYTCSYYNLMWQWVVNPSYGGLVSYPTVPTTCSGSLPVFLAGWPNTQMYVCVSGVPVSIGGYGSGVTNFSAPSGSWPSWLVPIVTNPTTTPSLTVAASTVPLSGGGTGATTAAGALANLGGVPTSTTVNGHALSSNVTISASDLTTGTLPVAQLPSTVVQTNQANTYTTGLQDFSAATMKLPLTATESGGGTLTWPTTSGTVLTSSPSTAGTTPIYAATGTAVSEGPMPRVCPSIPNDGATGHTDASVTINGCAHNKVTIMLPTMTQGSNDCVYLAHPIFINYRGQVLQGGGYGNLASGPSCVYNATGGSAIIVSGSGAIAESRGGTCTTPAMAELTIAAGALSGVATVTNGGVGCGAGAGVTWEIVGNGTPGTAVFNPTWTGGVLASATVTPGTSSGYSDGDITLQSVNIHDFNITANSGPPSPGYGIVFTGINAYNGDDNRIENIIILNHYGGIESYGYGNWTMDNIQTQDVLDQTRTFTYNGTSPNSSWIGKIQSPITAIGAGNVYFVGDTVLSTPPVSFSTQSVNNWVFLANHEQMPGYTATWQNTGIGVLWDAGNQGTIYNSTSSMYSQQGQTLATIFTSPRKSSLATNYPVFTVASSTASGTLAAGTYCYSMYGINPSGTTAASNQQCATLASTGKIVATAQGPLAQGNQGTCTTPPVLILGVSSGAFDGTATVFNPGERCGVGAGVVWVFIGMGTPGNATVVPVWSSGAVASATVVPGTSTGYTAGGVVSFQTMGVCGRTSGSQRVMAVPTLEGNATTWTDDGSLTPGGACPSTSTLYYGLGSKGTFGDDFSYIGPTRVGGAVDIGQMQMLDTGEYVYGYDHIQRVTNFSGGVPAGTAYNRGQMLNGAARQSDTSTSDYWAVCGMNAAKVNNCHDFLYSTWITAAVTNANYKYYATGTLATTAGDQAANVLSNIWGTNNNYAPSWNIGTQNTTGTGGYININGGTLAGSGISIFGTGASPGSSVIKVDTTGLILNLGSANITATTAGLLTAATMSVAGHFNLTSTTAPTASTCGGGVAAGNDNSFQVTGISSATACTVTFNSSLQQGYCTANGAVGLVTVPTGTSKTSIVFGITVAETTITANCR